MTLLSQKDLKVLREKRLEENGYKCAICKRTITKDEAVVDHIHGTHKTMYPETNRLVRDVICADCNILLGKIENQYLRSSKKYKEEVPLATFLKNVSEYVEKYSRLENFEEKLVHPTEWKQPIIKRSNFAKFRKKVKELLNVDIEYPKSGKLTKKVKELAEKIGWEFEYYS